MKTKFRLLRRHIENGKRQDSVSCPIALCLSEALGRPVDVEEGRIKVDPTQIEEFLLAKVSKRLRNFIERFDAGKPVKPMRFNLKLE